MPSSIFFSIISPFQFISNPVIKKYDENLRINVRKRTPPQAELATLSVLPAKQSLGQKGNGFASDSLTLAAVRFASQAKLGAKRQRLRLRLAYARCCPFLPAKQSLGQKGNGFASDSLTLAAVRFASQAKLGAKRATASPPTRLRSLLSVLPAKQSLGQKGNGFASDSLTLAAVRFASQAKLGGKKATASPPTRLRSLLSVLPAKQSLGQKGNGFASDSLTLAAVRFASQAKLGAKRATASPPTRLRSLLSVFASQAKLEGKKATASPPTRLRSLLSVLPAKQSLGQKGNDS